MFVFIDKLKGLIWGLKEFFRFGGWRGDFVIKSIYFLENLIFVFIIVLGILESCIVFIFRGFD